MDGTDAEFWVNRGLSRTRLGHVEQAERDFTTALDRDPRHDMALLDRGELRGKK